MKKKSILFCIILIFFLLMTLYVLKEMGDTNLDGIPPIELSKKYELYAKDVNWKNIIVQKKYDYVTEKERQSSQYEDGIGYMICDHVKYYFVRKDKKIIGVDNGEYLLIDIQNDKIVEKTENEKDFLKYLSEKYLITDINWIRAREHFEKFG